MSRMLSFFLFCFLPRVTSFATEVSPSVYLDLVNDMSEIKELALGGEANAQAALGYSYYSGKYLIKDPQKAFRWFSIAANQHHSEACFYVANAYMYGVGSEMDQSAAFSWYLKAAESGFALAMVELGRLHKFGFRDVVRKDLAKAYEWYYRAALKESATAMGAIAAAHENGDGLCENPELAFYWQLRCALDEKQIVAQHKVGDYFRKGYGTKKNLMFAYRWYQITLNNSESNEVIEKLAQVKKTLGSASLEQIESDFILFLENFNRIDPSTMVSKRLCNNGIPRNEWWKN